MSFVSMNVFLCQQTSFSVTRPTFVSIDASCGYCSVLPNLLRTFGWNPGRRIYRWFGDKLKDKTGDADITFREVGNAPPVIK